MKKTVLLIVCVLAAGVVTAQSHSFRDTTYVRYQQFDFDAWLAADTVGDRYKNLRIAPANPEVCFSNTLLEPSDVLQYNYIDNPAGVDVAGISAVIYDIQNQVVPLEYLMLYEASPDTFELLERVEWTGIDMSGFPLFGFVKREAACTYASFAVPVDSSLYDNATNHRNLHYRIFDYYFDKPVRVYDSFYVGGTYYNIEPFFTGETGLSMGGGSYITFYTGSKQDGCYEPSLWKLYHYYMAHSSPYPLHQWYWNTTTQFLMVLPIIEVVDTEFAHAPECPRVSGLFVRGNYTDTVTVQWTADSLHTEYELSYGREGTAAADGTIVRLNNTTRWQFTDTSYSDIPMVAYVRTVCREYDTLRRSGWSLVRWRLHHSRPDDTAQHEGIAVPEEGSDLSRFVRLMPNPASGSVVVASSYGIEGVEVYDVRGERVLELSGTGRGTAADFDVSKWAKGTYVVLVRTPAGTTTKRLVVN
jgi:hypothetical protein